MLIAIAAGIIPPAGVAPGSGSTLVIDAVQNLFQDNRIKTTDCATGVSGNAVIVKKIQMDVMSEDEARDAIREAVRADVNATPAAELLARTYYERGQYADALRQDPRTPVPRALET